MRIVQIEEFFHADAGYQVNILAKYFVKEGHEVYVVVAEMDKMPDELTSFFGKDKIAESDREYEEKYGVKIIRVPIKAYFSGRAIFDLSLFKIVDSLKPDVVFVHGNDTFTGMQYILKSRFLHYPIVSDSHMLEMASVNRFSRYFRKFYKFSITPIIKWQHIPIIRTQDDDYVERCLGIPLANCPWISYGSDMMLFHPDEEVKNNFRKKYGISKDAFVAVFAGKLIESKGALLLAQAFKDSFNTDREVVLIAVGNTVGDYGKTVENTFNESKNTVLRFPTQKYEELAKYYQAADIAVFAKQCSLSFYDVQACGLPVISENNNINVDRCSHDNGLCFESDNVEDFRNKIQILINLSKDEFAHMSKNSLDFVLSEYDYGKKANEYLSVIEEKVDDWNRRKK